MMAIVMGNLEKKQKSAPAKPAEAAPAKPVEAAKTAPA